MVVGMDSLVHAVRILQLAHAETHPDRDYELEFSWIAPSTGLKHVVIPRDVIAEAERRAAGPAAETMA